VGRDGGDRAHDLGELAPRAHRERHEREHRERPERGDDAEAAARGRPHLGEKKGEHHERREHDDRVHEERVEREPGELQRIVHVEDTMPDPLRFGSSTCPPPSSSRARRLNRGGRGLVHRTRL